MTNETFTTKHAKTFTIAELARHLKIDEKKARDRFRANKACDAPMNAPEPQPSDAKNTKYIFRKNKTEIGLITAIISPLPATDA